jgi:hypothetical protein
MRPASATIEPDRNAGARECVLEQACVIARRAYEYRDFIEPHAMARFIEDPSRDFNALTPFARRREQTHFASRLALRRLGAGKQIPTQRGEVRVSARRQDIDLDTQRFEPRNRGEVAERDGTECFRCGFDQASGEIEFNRRFEWNIQQQERQSAKGICGVRGGFEQGRAFRRFSDRELLVEPFEEQREIRPTERQRAQSICSHTRQREFVQRACKGSWKSRRARDRLEVRQPVAATRFEYRTRRDGFSAQSRRGGHSARRQHGRREPCRELREAESVQTNGAAAVGGYSARKIVCGTARR